MKSDDTNIPMTEGTCDAFVAQPDGPGPFSAVLFFMDAFGLRPYLKDMALRLAAEGYYVLVPNLFYRTKAAPVLDATFPISKERIDEVFMQIRPLIQTYTPSRAKSDIENFLAFLDSQKDVAAHRFGLTGYCMGGRLAICASAWFTLRVAAAASFHAGGLVKEGPESPHLLARNIKAKLYVAHADHDPSMTPEQITTFEGALSAAGVNFRAELYPEAPHGFTMKDLPQYQAAGLRRHWENLIPFFKENL